MARHRPRAWSLPRGIAASTDGKLKRWAWWPQAWSRSIHSPSARAELHLTGLTTSPGACSPVAYMKVPVHLNMVRRVGTVQSSRSNSLSFRLPSLLMSFFTSPQTPLKGDMRHHPSPSCRALPLPPAEGRQWRGEAPRRPGPDYYAPPSDARRRRSPRAGAGPRSSRPSSRPPTPTLVARPSLPCPSSLAAPICPGLIQPTISFHALTLLSYLAVASL
ncbi:unnamed protein product [Gadus morhua 'NCC']